MLGILLVAGLSFAGKASKNVAAELPSTSSIRMRTSFDQDPSSYLGRFLKAETTVEQVDESRAMTLACSPFISHKFVKGGNVTFDEMIEVSSDVAARFSIPLVAKGAAESSASRFTRIQYTLTGKMIAEIRDPQGFADCCSKQPGQCTDRYVGEFLQGTGRIFKVSDASATAGVDVNTPQGSGGAGVAMGKHWEQSITFNEPVYFAFKLSETPQTRVASACGDWVQRPPQIPGGLTIVGSIDKAQSKEEKAKKKALNNALIQAHKSGLAPLGLSQQVSKAINGQVQMQIKPAFQMVKEMSGVRREVREWCVERSSTGGYTAKALVFFPR